MEGGRKAVELTISLQGERVAAGVEGGREGRVTAAVKVEVQWKREGG